MKKKLPSMYHQFKTLAGLDITKEPMEVGPTTHYIMGGIRVHPETQETNVNGLFAAGEVGAGLHGANRLGGNSLSDLIVFGKRAGEHAAKSAISKSDFKNPSKELVQDIIKEVLSPFDDDKTENPYEIHRDLQEIMGEYVGIIRSEEKLKEGLVKIRELEKRTEKSGCDGDRKYNPGWHEVLDLKRMITSSILFAEAALARKESRGAHTRDDYPNSEKDLTKTLYVLSRGDDGGIEVKEEFMSEIPAELAELIEVEY
ncbi:FAD-binding protein [archaeon]|nr:FAD-binding protein [archaeon]